MRQNYQPRLPTVQYKDCLAVFITELVRCRHIHLIAEAFSNNKSICCNKYAFVILIFVGKGSGSLIGGYLMKGFGTRPTYQIFAVVTLVTGIIYFIFNVAYLKKRPQLEGNDIIKQRPKKTNEHDNPEKHTNDISLDEKPRSKRINNKSNNKNNTINYENKGFLKEESQNKKNIDELNLTQIEVIRNARNIDGIEQKPIRKHKELTAKKNAIQTKIEKGNCFTNPNLETDNLDQSKITVENEQSTSKNNKHID